MVFTKLMVENSRKRNKVLRLSVLRRLVCLRGDCEECEEGEYFVGEDQIGYVLNEGVSTK